MTAPAAFSSPKPHQRPTAHRVSLSKSLNSLAANPWALSFTSFLLTALLIRSTSFNLF
jgi:hypothetical protein